MRSKFIKLLVCVCLGVLGVSMVSCTTSIGSEPMLKITTSTAVGNYFSNTNYYVVYENGATKKTDEFVPADVHCYDFVENDYNEASEVLSGLDITMPEDEKLNEIGNNILLLMGETNLKVISVNRLFVLGEHYYFTVLSDNGKKPISSKLFKYNDTDNTIKEMASFNGKGINHVEIYHS